MGVSDKALKKLPSKAKKGNATINQHGQSKAKKIFRYMNANAKTQDEIREEGEAKWGVLAASINNRPLNSTTFPTLDERNSVRNSLKEAALARYKTKKSSLYRLSSRADHTQPPPLKKSKPSSPPTSAIKKSTFPSNDESSNFLAFHDNNSSPSTPISSKSDDDASSPLETPSRQETFVVTEEFEKRHKQHVKQGIANEKRRTTIRENKKNERNLKHQIRLKRRRYDQFYDSDDNSDDWSVTSNEKYLAMGSSSDKRTGMLQ